MTTACESVKLLDTMSFMTHSVFDTVDSNRVLAQSGSTCDGIQIFAFMLKPRQREVCCSPREVRVLAQHLFRNALQDNRLGSRMGRIGNAVVRPALSCTSSGDVNR